MQMKKAFIVAMAALLSVGAMAQTPKGFDKGGLDKMKARTEMRKASMKRDANKVKKDLPTLPVDYTAATKASICQPASFRKIYGTPASGRNCRLWS